MIQGRHLIRKLFVICDVSEQILSNARKRAFRFLLGFVFPYFDFLFLRIFFLYFNFAYGNLVKAKCNGLLARP